MMEDSTDEKVQIKATEPHPHPSSSPPTQHETFTQIDLNPHQQQGPDDVTHQTTLSPSIEDSHPSPNPPTSPEHARQKVNARTEDVRFNSRTRDEEFRQLSAEDEHLSIDCKPPAPPQRPPQRTDRTTLYCAILFVAILALAFFRAGDNSAPAHQITKEVPVAQSAVSGITDRTAEFRRPTMGSEQLARTPKILWVLTAGDVDGMPMIEGTAARHLMHVGRKSGFDVRIVDAFSAYDWLSPEMVEQVRVAKHKSKYMLGVEELLRVALLVEHGGLSVRFPHYIFPDDLEWLYQLLEKPSQVLMDSQEGVEYCEGEKEAEVVLFYERGADGSRSYEDWVIFARKQSRLMVEVFDEMSQLVQAGSWDYKYLVEIEETAEDVGVKYVKNMLMELINFKQLYWFTGNTFCKEYQVLSIDKGAGQFVLKISDENTLRNELMADRKVFFEKHGKVRMIEADLGGLNINIAQVVAHEQINLAHQESIFRKDIIDIDGNRWMLQPANKTREVRYCILSLRPLPALFPSLLQQSIDRLAQQSYTNWHAVYFVEGLPQGQVEHSSSVRLVNASEYEGLNLQRAATRHCLLGEVALLLDYDEWLGHEHDLRNMEGKMRIRDTYGLFLSFKYNNDIYKARLAHESMRRRVNNPSLPLLQEVAHHFRVFTIDSYRLIPHMTLHDNAGLYFGREVALLTLLEMGWDYGRCYDPGMQYHTKRVEHLLAIPKDRAFLPHSFIVMPRLRQIDITRQEYVSKFAARTFCQAMQLWTERKRQDMRRFFILNDGSEFLGLQERKGKEYPQLIEKKIHQIWVGQEMPKFKQFLTQKVKESHPDYQYFLWTNDNITRDNFPVSYDIINTLLDFNKHSKYNKLSMVSDLMRAEIVLNHGGVYLDTNYLLFGKNSLDDWLTFRGVFATQLFPFHRFHREGSIFAAPKGSPALRRLTDHRAISTRNYYSKFAHIEAGPSFFSSTVQGQEELDPSILQPSFEQLFPYYPWDSSNAPNLCEAASDTKELFFKNKRAYRKDCSERYPWAIGINFWDEGKSWA